MQDRVVCHLEQKLLKSLQCDNPPPTHNQVQVLVKESSMFRNDRVRKCWAAELGGVMSLLISFNVCIFGNYLRKSQRS